MNTLGLRHIEFDISIWFCFKQCSYLVIKLKLWWLKWHYLLDLYHFSTKAEETSKRMDLEIRRPNVDDNDSVVFDNNNDPGILCKCIFVYTLPIKYYLRRKGNLLTCKLYILLMKFCKCNSKLLCEYRTSSIFLKLNGRQKLSCLVKYGKIL